MTYEELVKKVETAYAKADASAVTEHVAVQFNITGEGEGALYVEVADGKIDIQPFEYYDRDAIITSDAAALVEIVSGKIGAAEAYGKGLLSVEGDLAKASLLDKIVLKKTRKAAEKKTTEKKATEKKAPAKKAAAKEAPAEKKAEAPKAAAKKAEASKAEAPKAAAKKAPAKKTAKAAQ